MTATPVPGPADVERRIVEGAKITGERVVDVDAVVIGTGAGGAPVAKELAEGGLRVAMLEEGEWHETASFTARPRDMALKLYRDAGQTVTVGTPPIVIPLGRAVGGTTMVNMATCFRTPEHVLGRWRSDLGLESMTPDALAPVFDHVEETIGVQQVTPELAGANARLVARGAELLGLHGDYLRRNVRGCVGSGVCAFGCPSGAKQHTGVTWVPLAWAAGATTYTGARAREIVVERGRVTGVVARTAGGGTLRVRARTVVVSCGTLITPLLLRRNGLGTGSGWLGRNLSVHPASNVRAVMDEPVDPWQGVPQSFYIDALAGEGVMFEGIAGPPDQAAMATPGSGAAHRDLMLDVRRTASFGVMVTDTSRGEIRTVAGQPVIRYDMNAEDARRFQRGFEVLAELFFAVGARKVVVPVPGLPLLTGGDLTPLRERTLRPRDIGAMAFHPLGTARAGADPSASVVDEQLQVHGVDGLFVADGSVVPSSLGVNPQVTIMALGVRLARYLLTRTFS